MNADPIFYTPVDGSVQAVLNRRKRHYSIKTRDSDAHEWLFRKMAWATARASNSARKEEARLEIPIYGGLGSKNGPQGVSQGVYNAQGGGKTFKYFPKPQIESVNISAEGDFGSIIKLELKFQVHRLADLNKMQPFFDIGGDVAVAWGWSRAGMAGGKDGYFQGKIYNFSYSVNSAGGFDCSTYAMMPGITIIGGNPDAPTADALLGLTDDSGNVLSANSLINRYKYEEQLLATQIPISTDASANNGLQLVRYSKDWSEARDPYGIKEGTAAERQKQAAILAGRSQTIQIIEGTSLTFNSNAATLVGFVQDFVQTSLPAYEVKANDGNLYKVVKKPDGTYRFYVTSETLYNTQAEAVAAELARQAAINQQTAVTTTGPGIQISPGPTRVSNQIQSELHLYISLERLVEDINKIAQENSSWFGKNGVKLVCNGDVTKGLVPKDNSKLVSANPTELLFPGFAKYGSTHEFTFGPTFEDAMRNNGDLSKCMISFKWLREVFTKIGTEKTKNTKSAENSVAGLLQRVFDLIYKHSGERFKLTMISNPRSKTGTEILIVDVNYIDDKTTVKAYPITAVDDGSIVRSLSLQSKVPNEFQTAAFVAASNGFSGQNAGNIGNVLGKVPGDEPNPILSSPETLEQAKLAMDSAGVTPDNVKSLQAALKRERISLPFDSAIGKEVIPFPLDFSVTLDGVEGFIFGNVITCNYLPAVYQKSETLMAFTVTKVNHTIANNDWTTTLNTVCRIVS